MEILVVNGLLDIFEEELRDGDIDYLHLTLNLLTFLQTNTKHYKNFTSDKLENIIILSIDEILTKKFQLDLDEKQLTMALKLIKNSYLFKSFWKLTKDLFIKLYYKCNCKPCYKFDNVTIEMDKSRRGNF
jgi:hypothetical protein